MKTWRQDLKCEKSCEATKILQTKKIFLYLLNYVAIGASHLSKFFLAKKTFLFLFLFNGTLYRETDKLLNDSSLFVTLTHLFG